ncbi:MAG: serine/threonine protein kinase [Gemmatimonadota bacterium]|nr:MAG: serine/threonine protein kinase [Gemmatimonadota bacterium]
MKARFLEKAADTPTPTPSIASASLSGLPPDLLQEASKRLGWAALAYAGTFFLASIAPHLLRVETTILPPHEVWDRGFQLLVSVISIVLGLSVFVLSRYARIRPDLLLDLGLVFEVVGAFGISMAQFWGVYPEWNAGVLQEYVGIPWECVWIVFFPLLAPNTPGKTALAAVAAASTGLLTILLSKAAGATSPDAPMTFFLFYFAFTTYVCAGLAIFVSRIVYRFGHRLRKAREIGSYHLVKPLGKGGMGEVWLAQHRMLARPAAIKLIRPEALGKDDASRLTVLRRFEREARATAALGSFNTIQLYDFGITEEGSFYYVMELLNGLNLDGLVWKFGPVAPARTAHILRQVCRSLGEAHESGLVHRDVKPANIYVCRVGPDYDVVKVLDFGLVKSFKADEPGATELTAEGIATGTPAFMAPELAMGKGEVDGRTDIYGVGCVAYWLLTGQRVFEADGSLATVLAHVQEQPVPPSQRSELEIPESLEQVVLACLEKDPAARPQSAAELDERLVACGLDSRWEAQQAKDWWTLHMPESDFAELEAEAADLGEASLLTVQRESIP